MRATACQPPGARGGALPVAVTWCAAALLLALLSTVHAEGGVAEVLSGVRPVSPDHMLKLARRVDESFARCFEVGSALCLGGQVLSAAPRERGLVARWTFDKLHPIDESGNGNHIVSPVVAGPPSTGHGSSAVFQEETGCRVLANSSLDLQEFTLDLRLYLLDGYATTFRNVLSRNNYAARTPALLLYPKNNKLSVRVATDNSSSEGITSNSAVPPRRWTQLTVVALKRSLKLYVNGMLDSSIALRGELLPSSGDIFLGKSLDLPGFNGYVDDVRLYNYAMGARLVPAFVSPSLTGFDAPFRVQLASAYCSQKEAASGGFCPAGCRLCTLDQLYRNAAHVARVNGWLHHSNQIWHNGVYDAAKGDMRAALCCC